ncbi:MAG: hypothetical protein QM676_05310 [Novosphingobium sp.]
MSEFVTRDALRTAAVIVPAPAAAAPQARDEIDRTFELPTGLYVATAGLYLGFVGIMAATFGNAGLAIPLAIFALFIAAAFGTPALWARMSPAKSRGALTYGALKNRGIMTATGRLGAGAATAQVLVLPVLIFFWGIAIAIIAALT